MASNTTTNAAHGTVIGNSRDGQTSGQTERGKQVVDPIAQGFERMMECFDKLGSRMDRSDRRVDALETRPIHDPGPEFDALGDRYRQDYDVGDQNPDLNLRNRWGYGRGRRGDDIGPYRGRGGRTQPRRNGAELHQPGYRRNRINWDLPAQRRDNWDDEGQFGYRQATCWDPPQRRGRYNHNNSDHPKGGQMQAPHFDGLDTANWISRVQYYFDHVGIPEEERLHYVVMLFDPPASEWIFNYRANNGFVNWLEFLEDVRHRFDPQSFRNYTGLIAKLMQTGTVAEYHDTFERYLNRVEDLSEKSLIPIFVAGLKQPIQEKVELQHPTSLAATMALALRLAATQEERHQQSSTFTRRQWSTREGRTSLPTGPLSATSISPGAQTMPAANTGGTATDRNRPQPIRVSNAEKAERSRRGLCWHCPEKWGVGHVCKVKLLSYIGEDLDEESDMVPPEDTINDEVITADLSHLHALAGESRSRPFHVIGSIGSKEVRV